MIGIEFTLTDGSKESYDPINFPDDFEETEKHYIIHMAHEYKILRSDVNNIRHYDLCEYCGYELYPEGCKNCINEIN